MKPLWDHFKAALPRPVKAGNLSTATWPQGLISTLQMLAQLLGEPSQTGLYTMHYICSREAAVGIAWSVGS